ncbi:hypothetical protein PRZ48_014549 [Zasmidium cellare]|uniref:Uncharacterized protein n=1 Tax=Zasmidium cellare TaxID=395010 RepID=A0ABR0DYJ8_ZASCE|nr:hypothetical protein PRZ48_014549 [Zasmidium cellare]
MSAQSENSGDSIPFAENLGVLKQVLEISLQYKVASQLGFIVEGRNEQGSKNQKSRGRSFESGSLDAWRCLSARHVQMMEGMSSPEKLQYLDALEPEELENEIRYIDHKLCSWQSSTPLRYANGTPIKSARINLSAEQIEHASHVELSWRDDLSVSTVLPTWQTPAAVLDIATLSFTHFNTESATLHGALSPWTVPRPYVSETIDSLENAIEQGSASFRVPYNEIEIPLHDYDPRLRSNMDKAYTKTQGRNEPGFKAFNFLQRAIQESGNFRTQKWRLEAPDYQPFGEDAELIDGVGAKKILQLKLVTVEDAPDSEDNVAVKIPLVGDETQIKRISPFHPERKWHYFVMFFARFSKLCFLPCSEIDPTMWSGSPEVQIPRSTFDRYVVNLESGYDWIEAMCLIMDQFPGGVPERKSHSYRAEDLISLYTAYSADGADDSDLDEEMQEAIEALEAAIDTASDVQPKQKYRIYKGVRYPKEVIGQINRQCVVKGSGILLPTGISVACGALPQAVFVAGYDWSAEAKEVYWRIGKLPLSFHTGDIPPEMPIIPMRIMRMQSPGPNNAARLGYPTWSMRKFMGAPPFPCLHLLKPFTASLREFETNSYLIPSEFIDVHRGSSYEGSKHLNIDKCLGDHRMHEFRVRDGLQTWESLEELSVAQFSPEGHILEDFPIPWYQPRDGTKAIAHSMYMVPMREVLQEIANFYAARLYKGEAFVDVNDDNEEDDDDDDEDDEESEEPGKREDGDGIHGESREAGAAAANKRPARKSRSGSSFAEAEEEEDVPAKRTRKRKAVLTTIVEEEGEPMDVDEAMKQAEITDDVEAPGAGQGRMTRSKAAMRDKGQGQQLNPGRTGSIPNSESDEEEIKMDVDEEFAGPTFDGSESEYGTGDESQEDEDDEEESSYESE